MSYTFRFGNIFESAKNVWNTPVPFTPQHISTTLNVAYNVATFTACIIPKDILPSITLPALAVLAIAKETIPLTIQKLSEDLSLTTIAKCTVFTAAQFIPLTLEHALQQKSVKSTSTNISLNDSELYGPYCSKDSETEKVFQNLKQCVQKNPIADCMQYDNPVTQGITLTLPCRGNSSQPAIHFESTREVTLLRVDSTIHFVTKGSIDNGFKGATNLLGFENKPRVITCNRELKIQIVTYKKFTDESCVFTQKIPPNPKIGSTPVCVITASPSPEEKYITCLEKPPVEFSLKDGAVQYTLPSTIQPVFKEEAKIIGGKKFVNKKMTSFQITNPCQHGLLPKSQCENAHSG